jgi:hypothetical protein
MLAKTSVALLFGLALLTPIALAKQAYVNIEQRLTEEQRHATGIDTLSPAQLAALNAVLRDQEEVVEASAVQRSEQAGGGSLAGFNDEPIKSRLKGSVISWEPGTVFELENGQRWKVLKGYMKMRKEMQAPEIIVVPGLAGRWFLQVDEDLPKARVYRID